MEYIEDKYLEGGRIVALCRIVERKMELEERKMEFVERKMELVVGKELLEEVLVLLVVRLGVVS